MFGTESVPASVGTLSFRGPAPMTRSIMLLTIGALLIASCSSDGAQLAVRSTTHQAGACGEGFVAHDLDHVTAGGSVETSLFDGTGAGVTVVDIDADGDEDVLLPNLSGWTTLHRNQGDLVFAREDLIEGRFRQIAPIDTNGDGLLDLVLTTGLGRPLVLEQDASGFSRSDVDAFTDVAYSISWGDVDGDGDVDVATGSYNAELTARRDMASVMGRNSGVTFYENEDGDYGFRRMSDLAQALVVRFHDVDADGEVDLMVGNDLATPDELWLRSEGRWTSTQMFDRTTFSTMSLDAADVDNDGDVDIYATDMHPMSDDAATLEAWKPVMEDMEALPRVDDIQAMENVLLLSNGRGFDSRATDLGVEATGWSWSGVFGDLDNDGFVDLYVVNGMESPAMFPNLEGGALVEENQALRNMGGAGFVPVPEWGLADTAQGRGMAMSDLDGDGDLDIVVNNLNDSARIYENRLCSGDSLTMDLAWLGTDNLDALGARIEVETADGGLLVRTVDANRGYLSSGGPGVHVGVGNGDVRSVAVIWPDGERSTITEVKKNTHIEIVREST